MDASDVLLVRMRRDRETGAYLPYLTRWPARTMIDPAVLAMTDSYHRVETVAGPDGPEQLVHFDIGTARATYRVLFREIEEFSALIPLELIEATLRVIPPIDGVRANHPWIVATRNIPPLCGVCASKWTREQHPPLKAFSSDGEYAAYLFMPVHAGEMSRGLV